MSRPTVARSLRLAALLAACCTVLGPAARAADPRELQVSLEIGPVIGGQDFITHLTSTEANALGIVFLGFDGTPTVLGNPAWPAFSLELGSALNLLIATNAQGQVHTSQPTNVGDFGPVATGLTLFAQAVLLSQTIQRVSSNREAVEVEPGPVGTGWLTLVSSTNLPGSHADTEGFVASAGDFDRDGVPDLALTGLRDSTGLEFVALWINDGSGQFSDETAARLPGFVQGTPVGFVRAVDLDQNNLVDLIISGGDDGTDVPDTAWINDGYGVFEPDPGFAGGAFTTAGLTPGDFDNDGRLDLIRVQVESSANPGVFPTDSLTWNTTGGWVEDAGFASAPWNDPSDDVSVYVAGDVDNDGDLDLFAPRFGLTNMLLRNDGAGSFVDVSATDLVPSTGVGGPKQDDSLDGALGDLDLDGWLDAVVLNTYFSFSEADSGDLYRNDGTGVLVEDNTSAVETVLFDDGFRITVDIGDLDLDGDPDIYFGGHDLFAGTNQVLLLNQGGVQGGVLGDLNRQNWFDPAPFITSDVELFDMDADGDLEVLQLAAGVVSGAQQNGIIVHLFENTTR